MDFFMMNCWNLAFLSMTSFVSLTEKSNWKRIVKANIFVDNNTSIRISINLCKEHKNSPGGPGGPMKTSSRKKNCKKREAKWNRVNYKRIPRNITSLNMEICRITPNKWQISVKYDTFAVTFSVENKYSLEKIAWFH